ncbi:MAG TPA: hypothetical protein VFZ53_08040 [Polyangiaceae bacterium]
MGSVRAALAAIVLGSWLSAAPAWAQDGPAPEAAASEVRTVDDFETWLAAQRDTRGRACDRRAVEALSHRWFVACGDSGLWLARRSLDGVVSLVRIDDLGGPVVGLFRREGRVWAEVMRREARDVGAVDENSSHAAFPSDAATRAPSSSEVPRATSAPPVRGDAASDAGAVWEGRVVRLLPGEVVVDIGLDEGLRQGDRVELSVVTHVDVGGERAEEREIVAVGVVNAVSARFARVALGIGERVPLGAAARAVETPPTARRAAPPRIGGLWHAGFMLRPFLALEDYGGGFLADASVGYRFDAEIHVEAVLSPFAYGTAEDKPSVVPVGAFVKASYDSDVFEVGLGIGGETVKDTPLGTEPGSGILLVQHMRLGALDGLDLDIQSHAVLFHSRFEFSGLVGRGQIPVGRRFWLLFAGGGGSAGYGYGEAGVRTLLRGNGDRGSFFFTGTIGGMGVFENRNEICREDDFTFQCPEEASYAGPMIGAGGEWRF